MKLKELKELTNEELASHRAKLKQEALNLRVQQQTGQLENPALIKTIRREIARIATILNARHQEQAASKAEA